MLLKQHRCGQDLDNAYGTDVAEGEELGVALLTRSLIDGHSERACKDTRRSAMQQ